MKQIFDKDEWLEDLKEKKMQQVYVDAFHYVGDVIEDILSVLTDHIDELHQLKKLLAAHKHLDGKVVREV